MLSDADRTLDRLARRQHGAFSRAQARSAGLTGRMVDHRLARRAWLRLDTGVYALASHPATWLRQAMAATLAVDGAVLSGPAAAALLGIEGARRGRLEITVPRGRRGARCGLASVRTAALLEATVVEGIPCTPPARTVVDLARTLPVEVVLRCAQALVVARSVGAEALADRCRAALATRQPGAAALRRVVEELAPGTPPAPTSALERRLRRLLRGPGMPPFDLEVAPPWWPAGQGRVDACSTACALIVEADGRRWHTREQDFAADRRRDNLAAAHGYAVVRLTTTDLHDQFAASRALILRVVARRRRDRAPDV